MIAATPAPLSPRELEILHWLGEGKAPTEIAVILGISVKTVSTYRSRLLEKLQLENTAQAMRYAILDELTRDTGGVVDGTRPAMRLLTFPKAKPHRGLAPSLIIKLTRLAQHNPEGLRLLESATDALIKNLDDRLEEIEDRS